MLSRDSSASRMKRKLARSPKRKAIYIVGVEGFDYYKFVAFRPFADKLCAKCIRCARSLASAEMDVIFAVAFCSKCHCKLYFGSRRSYNVGPEPNRLRANILFAHTPRRLFLSNFIQSAEKESPFINLLSKTIFFTFQRENFLNYWREKSNNIQ